jgi:hypothetical protein
MPSGVTNVGVLSDSLPTVIQSARIVREFAGVMPRLVDRQRLGEGEGLNWNEIALSQLTAQDITESTKLENYQQMVDTLFSITPAQVGLAIKVTDRAKRRISKNVAALMGSLGQKAMNTKKDKNLLAIGASATTDLGTANNPMTSGLVSAASARITGNTTEHGSDMPKYLVATSFHVKDLQDEIVAGIGTYTIPAGLTEDTFRRGFSGTLFNMEVFTDDNLTVDGSDDAIAIAFGRDAIVHVEGYSPRAVTVRDEAYGGGSDIMYMYDEYATGIRQQAWLYAITADSTAPTS